MSTATFIVHCAALARRRLLVEQSPERLVQIHRLCSFLPRLLSHVTITQYEQPRRLPCLLFLQCHGHGR